MDPMGKTPFIDCLGLLVSFFQQILEVCPVGCRNITQSASGSNGKKWRKKRDNLRFNGLDDGNLRVVPRTEGLKWILTIIVPK